MKTELKFWGVRGSLSCGPSEVGCHTSCCELQLENGVSFFFDAGTGIKSASKNRQFRRIYLFLSHFHWDHIQGLPFFEALSQDCEIEILSTYKDCRERLDLLFDERFHPVPFCQYEGKARITILEPGDRIEREGLQISTINLSHPGGSTAFMISSDKAKMVFATDTDFNPITPEIRSALRHADVAILDSQYLLGDAIQKAHYGHASFKTAIDVAAQNFVKTLYLYSLDLNYSDAELYQMEDLALDYALSAYEGSDLRVKLAKEGLSQILTF